MVKIVRRVEGVPGHRGVSMGVRRRTGLLLVLLLACCAPTALAAGAQPARAASISVQVRAADTLLPLAGIRVDLYQSMPWGWGGDWRYGYSDAVTGGVRFDGLVAGTYVLESRDPASAYASSCWSDAFTRAEAKKIVLAADTVYAADVRMLRAGRVAGVVTDEYGTPLGGISLWVGMEGQAGTGRTAADGSFDIGGLLPGAAWKLYAEDTENEDYVYQWWDGQRVVEDATPLSVASGQTTTVAVKMLTSAHIDGTITTRFGLPARDVAAQAFRLGDDGRWVAWSGECCHEDGSFRIFHLPAGTYIVAFWDTDRPSHKRYYPDTALRSEATTFTLAAGETIDLHEVVWNDTQRPTPAAPDAEVVDQDETADVRMRVNDPRPFGPRADVTIKVRTRGGKLVKTVVLPRRRVNTWLHGRFLCDLPRGQYRYSVYARDSGGNRETRPAVNTLRVR